MGAESTAQCTDEGSSEWTQHACNMISGQYALSRPPPPPHTHTEAEADTGALRYFDVGRIPPTRVRQQLKRQTQTPAAGTQRSDTDLS